MANDTERPIGYWLKRADALLTARIDAVQAAHGLTRLGWQLLTLVRDAAPSVDEAAAVVRPFADLETVRQRLADFEGRGWVAAGRAGRLSLTPQGTEVYAAAEQAQRELRRAVMDGISEDEYGTTLRTLRTLVRNLETAAAAPGDGAGTAV